MSQPNAPPPYPFRLWLLLATFGKRSAFGVPFVLKGTEGSAPGEQRAEGAGASGMKSRW